MSEAINDLLRSVQDKDLQIKNLQKDRKELRAIIEDLMERSDELLESKNEVQITNKFLLDALTAAEERREMTVELMREFADARKAKLVRTQAAEWLAQHSAARLRVVRAVDELLVQARTVRKGLEEAAETQKALQKRKVELDWRETELNTREREIEKREQENG